jgi:hypothetical protein
VGKARQMRGASRCLSVPTAGNEALMRLEPVWDSGPRFLDMYLPKIDLAREMEVHARWQHCQCTIIRKRSQVSLQEAGLQGLFPSSQTMGLAGYD